MANDFFNILRPLKDDELVEAANKALRRFNELDYRDCGRDIRLSAEIILILAELKWKVPKARGPDSAFAKRLQKLQPRFPSEIWDAFYEIRETGNGASHPGGKLSRDEAANALQLLTRLGQWALNGFAVREPTQSLEPSSTAEQPSKKADSPHVGTVLPSDLEQFFHFRKYRATGTSKW